LAAQRPALDAFLTIGGRRGHEWFHSGAANGFNIVPPQLFSMMQRNLDCRSMVCPLPDVSLPAFRRQLGYVPQKPFRLSGTIPFIR
jgi:hypothetical protein